MSKVLFFINPKGGSGKSTITIHTAVALSKMQFKILVLDLDYKQNTTHNFNKNRQSFLNKYKYNISLFDTYSTNNIDNYIHLFSKYDFILIDTPGNFDFSIYQQYLCRSICIITPINESFLDLSVIHNKYFLNMIAPYNKKWLIVTNRRNNLYSDHYQKFKNELSNIKKLYNPVIFEGFFESTIFKEMYSHGLTLIDNEALGLERHFIQKKSYAILKEYMLLIRNYF